MPTKKSKKRKAHPPLKTELNQDRLVRALVDAQLVGAQMASTNHAISARTLFRRLGELKAHPDSQLAQLVREAATERELKHGDLLDQAFEASVKRLIQLAPAANHTASLNAVEKLGDLRLARETLSGSAGAHSVQGQQGQAVTINTGPVLSLTKSG
jgi:hypothetical protein